jgi:Zn-dependent protease with chaperone function
MSEKTTRTTGWRQPGSVLALIVGVVISALSATAARAQGVFRITEKQEVEVGRRAAIEIEMEMPILEDQALTRYLDRLGQRLARESGRSHLRYRFKIINGDEVNAFALPGGFIYVYRGLIEAAETEGELAGVLGHEIGHIVARHHVSQIRRSQMANLGFWALGPVFGSGLKAAATKRAGSAALEGLFSKFSREDEREADRLGAKNLYDAGYDPRGMAVFFEKLAALRESKPNLLERFFATHPAAEERANNIADLLESFPAKSDLRADSPEFQQTRQRLAKLYPQGSQPGVARTVAPGSGKSQAETGETQAGAKTASQLADEAREREREIASIFAPIFYQGLGEHPRYDYITNFDFDRDWRGDNNWNNAANPKFPLKAYVYYAVRETPAHYFIHYAAFHPRDYKGGKRMGRFLSKAIRKGVTLGGRYDPTGRADEAVLAHENDLEGCLVVAEKNGDDLRRARVVFVETLAHNKFYKYVPEGAPREGFETIILQGQRPKLFVEPKGHGIEAYRGDEQQLKDCRNGTLLYTFTGRAEDSAKRPKGPVGYDLVPISTTLWPPAHRGLTPAYAETHDYGTLYLNIQTSDGRVEEREFKVGRVGSAFRGGVGGRNLARPPWGWFDGGERDLPLGEWFFDPARTIKKHFNLDDSFPTVYLEAGATGVFGKIETSGKAEKE